MSVTVVVPTTGRESLGRTIDSLVMQTEPEDEVLIVSDGPANDYVRETLRLVRRVPGTWRLLELEERAGDWGATPRNHAYAEATGRVLWHIDDDDAAAPGALELIRKVRRPTIFRMESSAGWTLWRDQRLEVGNVGTPMIAAPRLHCGPWWGSRYEGDFDYIERVANEGRGLDWREEIVALIRPAG